MSFGISKLNEFISVFTGMELPITADQLSEKITQQFIKAVSDSDREVRMIFGSVRVETVEEDAKYSCLNIYKIVIESDSHIKTDFTPKPPLDEEALKALAEKGWLKKLDEIYGAYCSEIKEHTGEVIDKLDFQVPDGCQSDSDSDPLDKCAIM